MTPVDVSTESRGNAVRRIIRQIVDSGVSYADIAADIQARNPAPKISTDSIRKFVGRQEAGVHASGTLNALFDYIQVNRSTFKDPFVRECIAIYADVFLTSDIIGGDGPRDPTQQKNFDWYVSHAYRVLYRMLGVKPVESRGTAAQLAGVYAAFRASSRFPKEERVVVSRVSMGPKPGDDEATEFRHVVENNIGDRRYSDGFVVATRGGNVFLIGDIEYGNGLEMMMFRRPSSHSFRRLVGLTMTLDTNGFPITTKIVLIRVGDSPWLSEPNFTLGPEDVDLLKADLKALNIDDFEEEVLKLLPERAEALDGI